MRLGRATGSVPRQYHFDLGGFSSLRGYGFKEFSGDRMALFNAEHWMQGGRINVGFFADAGSAWLADEADFDLQVSGGLGLHRDYLPPLHCPPCLQPDARPRSCPCASAGRFEIDQRDAPSMQLSDSENVRLAARCS